MLKTQNNVFYTYYKNLPLLREFIRIFDIDTSITEFPGEILSLEELIASFCENKIVKNHKKDIEEQIKKLLTKSKNPISLKSISSNLKLKSSSFYYYFNKAKKELESQGKEIIKVGFGTYIVS